MHRDCLSDADEIAPRDTAAVLVHAHDIADQVVIAPEPFFVFINDASARETISMAIE